MDANELIGKLKANNTAKDISDLDKVCEEYKVILDQLPLKDRAAFSLNVLCVLCRNLDKAPKWRDSINNKALLVLSIYCVRETRATEKEDRVKTLACVYHIHRHVVRQYSSVPPELMLKISYMPFELEAKYLLNEYAKTYWNILVDRLSYIEQLRNKILIIKLLPKIAEDAQKIIEIYDTVQFCTNIIVFLIKKLHFLYTEKYSKELNQIYREIFAKISEKDFKVFRKLQDKDVMDIYVKLNECVYIVAENASRICFKDSPLDNVVRTCISIVGHRPDLFHCLQTLYSNAFCSILTPQTHSSYNETVLSSLLISIETTEKLGYLNAMIATYPYLNQFLRLYIEYNINNCNIRPWKDTFNTQIQEICLKLMHILMKKLKNCSQLLKCDGCEVKTGLHDSLRLSFLVKNFLTISITQNLIVTETFPLIHDIISQQYEVLNELNELGCVNYEKCFRKLQIDIHNTAIILNKAQYYEFSVKLFNIYLDYEMKTSEQKNISRALYNKSICELDSKLYEDALINAFLSLVYGELSSDKYISLVIDIKAKELKTDNGVKKEELQMMTVVDACEKAVERKMYGDISSFLMDLKFSELLKHEFTMYSMLWPSVTPIGGVWRSLLRLSQGKYMFTDADATWSLYEVIAETPAVVRTITNDHFNTVVTELLDTTDDDLTPDMKMVNATLLFLKTEFELAAAGNKYGWKPTEPVQNFDLDQMPSNRTIPQEFNATKPAVQAVALLTELSPDFNIVSNRECLQNSLRIYEVSVQLLIHLSRDMEAMQLAYICCCIADCVDDREVYVRSAGVLLQYGGSNTRLHHFIETAASACAHVSTEISAVFLCDASMYYSGVGSTGVSALLIQRAQALVLAAIKENPDTNLDLAIGRLLEAQSQLCNSATMDTLSVVNGTQRHYLSIGITGTKWLQRRLHSLTVRVRCHRTSLLACNVSRSLRVWRRARASAAAAYCSGAAGGHAALCAVVTDTNCFDDAQIKIDNRLKHILGLQSTETQNYTQFETKKQTITPKQDIETMLDSLVFKKSQASPSMPCDSVPAFVAPTWSGHDDMRHECGCYACCIPLCYILACHTSGLEASTYYRADERDIARNYFNGVVKLMSLTEEKFRHYKNRFVYEEFVVDSVMKYYCDWLREVKVEVLGELSFFELKNGDFEVADEHIVEIHEVLQEISIKNEYVYNDVMNLMACSARLRNIKKPVDLEAEFESLRISPIKFTEPPKTPITKAKPPIITKVIVKDEELPKKRKVIKLNLDEEETEVKKQDFKVPVCLPATSRHVLEIATPINKSKRNEFGTPSMSLTRSRRGLKTQSRLNEPANFENFATPKIFLTQPSEDSPKNTTLYSTPKDLTPDKFFTPLTSVKTYKKKSLRHNIVKNLEQEFLTPSVDKKQSVVKNSLEKKDGEFLTPSVDKKKSVVKNSLEKTDGEFLTPSVDKKQSVVKNSLEKTDGEFLTPSVDKKQSVAKNSLEKKDSEFLTPSVDKKQSVAKNSLEKKDSEFLTPSVDKKKSVAKNSFDKKDGEFLTPSVDKKQSVVKNSLEKKDGEFLTPSVDKKQSVAKNSLEKKDSEFLTPSVDKKQSVAKNSLEKKDSEFLTPSVDKKKSVAKNSFDKKDGEFLTPSVDKKQSVVKNSLEKKDGEFLTPSVDKKQSVAKNSLEKKDSEFLTPSVDKKQSVAKNSLAKDSVSGKSSLQVPKPQSRSKVKTLKRATSPGKLCKEAREVPRNRRLRKPVNFSLDDDDDVKR